MKMGEAAIIYYHIDGSPVCRAVTAVLKLLKLKYKPITVDLPNNEQFSPEYLEVSI